MIHGPHNINHVHVLSENLATLQNKLLIKPNLSQEIDSLKHKINSLSVEKHDRKSKGNAPELKRVQC